ncbi:hypothetical protein J1N10_18860 [Carboxylicivirga sp. A043]|uniref:YncE family protein n=1 Tax=Carboxylicivirga litoralis TaxID=2816963 RepID=UPI0021CB156D|nr:hypothetical protein [Carboxylicivirga sp. A043]MCU4158043.1 hypothetical protein [Carboxylicivirga sp. A043]
MKKFLLVAGVAATIGFTACNDVDVSTLEDHQGAYILNKGTSNSSISYYNYEDEKCINNYYQEKNGGTIGAGATQIAARKTTDFPKGLAYVALPSENNIEMINLEGFIDAGNIDDFTNPTDVLPSGETVIYVSHNSGVSSYDIKKGEVVKTFELEDKPQKLISSGKYLYAACAGDGTGAKVFVFDMSNNNEVDEIALVYDNPIDMVVDIDGNVWVYCSGDTQGLIKVKRTLKNEEPYIEHEAIEFVLGDNKGDKANPLTVSRDGRILYYVYGHLCSNSVYIEEKDVDTDGNGEIDIVKGDLSQEPIISGDYQTEAFNGIDYDGHRNRIVALTTGGELVVLKNTDDVWSSDEVHNVGENPLMTVFNY